MADVDQKYYLAIDIGASSGRHIIGVENNGRITLKEIYRFKNGMDEVEGELVWDTERLFSEILKGIALCIEKYKKIESLAIDTWGVDYALLEGDKLIPPVYAYRSSRTKEAIEEVHKRIPLDRIYELTGEQYQPFNTVYQLYADKMSGRLDKATDFLMIPEYFNYLLTGRKVKEYTNATTGAFVNAETYEYDMEIIGKLALPVNLFQGLHGAGEIIGDLRPELQRMVGGNIPVKLCASHDTACAFEAVDFDDDSVIISSGTWSLVGVKIPVAETSERSLKLNFANEGGIGYFRYLKNVMGMWIINSLSKELKVPVAEAVEMARKSTYRRIFDVNHESLIAPKSMKHAIESLVNERLSTEALFNSAMHSLASSYSKTVREIQETIGKPVKKIYIVGGGAKNNYLNELTEAYCGKIVVAVPIEATAMGNIKTQMMGEKEVESYKL